MALVSRNVGRSWGPVEGRIETRRTMAYAAGIGDDRADYYRTTSPDLAVHPLFPVSAEWSLLVNEVAADEPWPRADALRGVHATHTLVLHQALHADMSYWLSATVVRLEQRRPGAYQVVRFDARDAEQNALWTTWHGTLFLGVDVEGQPANIDGPELPTQAIGESTICGHFEINVTDAHVYSECAQIWNPIHTDEAIAQTAGLDGVLLHGTATLARSVTRLMAHLGVEAADVERVACRFASPARPGDVLSVRAYGLRAKGQTPVQFDVVDAFGRVLVCDASLGFRRPLLDEGQDQVAAASS